MARRCAWASTPELSRYHDQEWGRPCHDERRLFEMLLLEGFQAGLSWAIVLKKREAFRKALDGFDPVKIAAYGEADIQRLLADPALIRSERKLRAAVKNARAFLRIQEEFGSFDRYLWGFAPGAPYRRAPGAPVPAQTPLSQEISRDLKRRGLSFVGPVIVYAFLQSVGVVNDHEDGCDFA